MIKILFIALIIGSIYYFFKGDITINTNGDINIKANTITSDLKTKTTQLKGYYESK